MNISKVFRKAMVDKDIKGTYQLAELAGISYDKCIRIMKDQPSCKIVDVVQVANVLDLELKFISRGGE